MMVVKQFSQAATAKHGSLANRLGAILTAGAAGDKLAFVDEAEAPVPGSLTVLLASASAPSIARGDDEAGVTLRYSEAMDEATLGAAVACATEPGMPIAVDPESLSIIALADRLASSDIPVLITGPTGTGKEVLSRFIHDRSPRRKGPFIAINCAAMPETMLEAMLFGHEKGSFTGANAAGEGFFRAADGGTLLLDEIAEMPLTLQAKLLRALQEGEVVPIGATRPVKVDVRIVACANRDLPTEVDDGRFRADLYYRLNVFPLALSALRERPQDIAALAFAMILRHSKGHPIPWLRAEALGMLKAHSWPGNIRELENAVEHAVALSGRSTEITPDMLPDDMSSPVRTEMMSSVTIPDEGLNFTSVVSQLERELILRSLEKTGGNKRRAARLLNLSRTTLIDKLQRLEGTNERS
jgi:two-component system response regulator FlrC